MRILQGDQWNRSEKRKEAVVGTPKSKIKQYEKKWLDLPWQKVRDSVDVKLFDNDGELYVLAKSTGLASQRDRHAPQASGPFVAKASRDAPQSAFTRSTADAH
jgi:hypothetical protein